MHDGSGLPGDDVPALVVQPGQLIAVDESLPRLRSIPGSRMFEINEALAVFRSACPGEQTFDASQGDGGSSLPGVPRHLLDAAHKLQVDHGTGYDKPFGTPEFRAAVVEDYWQLDRASCWGPSNVIACQGGRDALLKAYDAIQYLGGGRRGDFVVTTRVPWISYNWGPYAVGANVMLAPGSESDAWALTPEGVQICIDAAASSGRQVAAVVITSPDNPTGRSIALDEQLSLARSAFHAGVPFVIFDWIYHRVSDGGAHDLAGFLADLGEEGRERCIFLDGITKSLGASNIRNAHLVAPERVVRFIQSRASHGVIPSYHSQAVAIAAYRMGFDVAAAPIVEPTNRSRVILAELLTGRGMRCILGKGYYAFVDVGPWLDSSGLEDSAALGSVLAEKFGLAVVPGVYFSDFGSRWIRFSYALEPETTDGAARRLFEALDSLA